MHLDAAVTAREELRHNPLNEVTASVERVALADGRRLVREQLRGPTASSSSSTSSPPGPWAASDDPRHWNSWRREADALRDRALRSSLRGTGLDLPTCSVEGVEDGRGAVLWMEDVEGTPGERFDLADHAALAAGLGRWQAQGPLEAPWTSRGFLRGYSGSKPVAWALVDDDDAWRQPLVRDTWPPSLRSGWVRLLGARQQLLRVEEALPRTRCHLDVWVANEIRRPTGEVVLLDWAFAGDGAVGEDVGNHVPDAVFDLFWPAERFEELEEACVASYLEGLREAGWRGTADEVRLGVFASCVKYAWLLPLLLDRAGSEEHAAYHRPADAHRLYAQRGLALARLVRWCDEALALARGR